MAEQPMLIFDGDCGFCTSAVQWLEPRLSRRDGGSPQIRAWQRLDLATLGVDPDRVQREVVWREPDGHQHGGAAAFAAWLRFRGGAYRALGRLLTLPGLRLIARAGYRLVAANRHRLPGGTPYCALPR